MGNPVRAAFYAVASRAMVPSRLTPADSSSTSIGFTVCVDTTGRGAALSRYVWYQLDQHYHRPHHLHGVKLVLVDFPTA